VWGWLTPVLVAFAIVVGIRGARFLTPDCANDGCPELEALKGYTAHEPARIYDASGDLVGQLPGPKRIVVQLDEIHRVVRDGYIAVEDRRFRSHRGVDPTSALRAFVVNLRSGSLAEGGSTITMQLARNLFEADVARWNPLRRKLAEIRVARVIEAQLHKDEILELYLNQIYLGDGVYGVEAASRHYFAKPVSQVGVREAALLIGLARNPEGYDPRQDSAAANRRIETVLEVLVREEVVSREEADEARTERVRLASDGSMPAWGKNAYYLAAVRRELKKIVRHPAQRSGLRVFTGLDGRAQAAAVDALASQIDAIEKGAWGSFGHEIPNGELPRMDESPYLQGMVVAMNPATGLVSTLVGGRDYHHSEFDRVFQARRQPGSTFVPIVYAAALARGVRLSDRISTSPLRVAGSASDWDPSDRVSAPELSVRAGLVESSSRVAVRLGRRVGVERVAELARRMGITTDIPHYPSILLGTAEVIPAELVAVFAAVGNGGRRVEPHSITHVVDRDGVVIYRRATGPGGRVLDENVAFLLRDVMRDAVRLGTGWQVVARTFSHPVAAQAGITTDARDVWFVGMTPGLVAGVWLGFDTPRTITRSGRGNLAAPVWASFMQRVDRGGESGASWRRPSGVEAIEIDARTGFRSTRKCPADTEIREYFLKGAGPSNGCSSTTRAGRRQSDPPAATERRSPSDRPRPQLRGRTPSRSSREAVEVLDVREEESGSSPNGTRDSVPSDPAAAPASPPDSFGAPGARSDSQSTPAADSGAPKISAPADTSRSRPLPPLSGPPITVPPPPR
jgi:penicillin-binding protein 1A